MGAAALIGIAIASAGEEVYSSVSTRNRENEMAQEKAQQQEDSLKLQKARASLQASDAASQRATQAHNVLAAQKAMAAARGTLTSPVFGSLVAGSASNYAHDTNVAAMNLTMTDDNLTAAQLQAQKALLAQEKNDDFSMWSGIGSAVFSGGANIAGAAEGGKQMSGAPKAIDSQEPGTVEGDDFFASQNPYNTNYPPYKAQY